MKLTIKSLAFAAALVASGLTNAASVTTAAGANLTLTDATTGQSADVRFNGGGGSLEFSNGTGVLGGVPTTAVGGLVGALNVGKVALTSVDAAVITETNVKLSRSTPRGVVSIGAAVNSLTADNVTGQVTSVGSFGGAQQDAAYLEGVLDGGRMTVKNLKFDLTNKVVYADLYGQALDADNNLGPLQTSLNTALWTISSISGPTAISPADLIATSKGNTASLISQGYSVTSVTGGYQIGATNILSGLKVTDAGFNFFASSLGLTPGSTGYTTLAGVNGQSDGWGSVKSTLSFTVTSAVPEPSTYALVAVGLMVVGFTAKRRQKA